MSFILKALKKLEDDKAARQSTPVEINSAILTTDKRVSSKPRTGIWLVIPMALLACIGLSYLFLHKTPPQVTEHRKYIPPPAPSALPAPPAAAVVTKEQSGQGAAVIKDKTGQGTVVTGMDAEKPVSRRVEAREKRMQAKRIEESAYPVPEPIRQGGPASSSLMVSGIAYQDNPAESMAVINGAIVKTGMTVAGVKVERIFVDRVRFRGDGGTFEVPLAR